MVIVSQDREGIVKRIINFDNTSFLGLDEGDHTSIVFEDMIKIGEYTTKERAKEVLQEIMDSYQTTELFKCTDTENQNEMANEYLGRKKEPFKYEMPVE